ncbi:MAG TPA: outer membrane beta-barrel protein [Polyangia bacterium]|jgi:opacity protein-like surface antigen
MRTALASLLLLLALAVTPSAAQAQSFVYVAPMYRPGPVYVPVAYNPNTVQLERRYSLGLRWEVAGINQTVAGEDVVMGGGGLMFRYRHSAHWGLEAAVDGLASSFANGRFTRSSVPMTVSLMCHLTPRGPFDLYAIGGIGYVTSDVRVENPPGHPDLAVGKQSFGEFQAHIGMGAELRLGRAFGLTADLRYVGRVLTDSQDGQYYKNIDNGVVPSTSQGFLFTMGGLVHF